MTASTTSWMVLSPPRSSVRTLPSTITRSTAVSNMSAKEGNCKCLGIIADDRRSATGFANHGLQASSSHALSSRTIFSVFYKPRTSSSEYVISVNGYLEAQRNKLSLGMRFKMKFEGDEPERRFSGAIVGIEEGRSSARTDSEWRCLKVDSNTLECF